MKLAFVLFKYFPYGGLQRDFRRIAEICHSHGHAIEVFTLRWEGEVPAGFKVHVVPASGWLGYFGKNRALANAVAQAKREGRFDAIVGFNKLPGLDVYYAADPCCAARTESGRCGWKRLTPRHAQFMAFEKAVFAPEAGVEILVIAPREIEHFIRHYGTPRARFHELPPGIARDRVAPPDAAGRRTAWRAEFGVADDELALLMVASAFQIKGVDRAIEALAALPEASRQRCRLFIVGGDRPGRFATLAERLGVGGRVRFCGARDDVPRFLLGADFLLHPARTENTGTVLLEALVAGLPVLCSGICGYAPHLQRAGAGRVLPEPFRQDDLNATLADMLDSPERVTWSRNGLDYARREDLYSLPERAAEVVETVAG
jgi:UDP-glucose:(heptosyl)LPS alpha-1,3-glucosyltransferase